MCDPISVAVVGAGIGVAGSLKSGQAAKKAGKQTQASYERSAKDRLEKITFDLGRADRNYRQGVGESLANIGQSGISRTSFYDVLADGASEFAIEKKNITDTGNNEARQLREQGSLAYQSGKDAQTASYFSAAGKVASAGVTIAGSQFQPVGTWQTTTRNASGQIF